MRRGRWMSGVGALLGLVLLGAFIAVVMTPKDAQAVAQWTRKYGEPCSTCHMGFPRLTYYGERFKRNGYQDPDAAEPDGDTRGAKRINEDLIISSINNWLGARLNIDVAKFQNDKLTIEGKKKTKVTLGNPNWLQLFVAGTVFKDVSIFIENEFEQDGFKFSWYWLGFHNLLGSRALNFQIGNVSPVDYASLSNRLRITPALKSSVFRIKSSNGKGDDSVDISRSRPGIQYFGEQGPVVWWAGVSPGSKGGNPNEEYSYWGGIRLEVTEAMKSKLEGSSVSFHGFFGTDACSSSSAGAYDAVTNDCAVTQTKNDFYRLTPTANLRFGDLDVQAGYSRGHDDNWSLSVTKEDADFDGFNIVGQYNVGSWLPGLMYDWIDADGPSSAQVLDRSMLTPFISWFPRDNFRVALYANFDLKSTDASLHPVKQNEVLINLRTMF